jgi:hypothetical protein
MNPINASSKTLAAWVLVAITSTIAVSAHAWEWPLGSRVAGSGQITKAQRAVQGFKGVDLEVPAQVDVIQGDVEGVSIETDDNIAPLIETVVEKDQLKVRLAQRSTGIKPTALKVTVRARNIESLAISGAGSFQADKIKGVSLATRISGSGDIRIRALDVDNLNVAISGSGNFTADGRADRAYTNIAGSGDVNAANLASRNVKLAISGSGDAKVWATESLTVSIAGVGNVGYYGDAAVSQSVSGSGSVKKLGSKP